MLINGVVERGLDRLKRAWILITALTFFKKSNLLNLSIAAALYSMPKGLLAHISYESYGAIG